MPHVAKWISEYYVRLTNKNPGKIILSLTDYLVDLGLFKNTDAEVRKHPVKFWSIFRFSHPELTELANHLLQIVPHAAAIERGWSQFGFVHNKSKHSFEIAVSVVRFFNV